MSLQQMMMLDQYANLQDTFIDLITDTHQGHTNPLLMPPDQLREQVQFIQAHLPNDLSLPGGAQRENLIDLYTSMNIKTRTMRDLIIFDIRLPLIDKNEFQIFKLHPVPVMHNDTVVSIKPSTEYLMVSLKRDLYTGLTEAQLRGCREIQPNFECKHHGVMFKSGANQYRCEMNLLLHKQTLDRECMLTSQPMGDQWIQLNRPNHWMFSMASEKTIDIVCRNEPYHCALAGQGILELQDHCSIQLQDLQIHSVYQITTRVDKSYLPSMNLTEQIISKNSTRKHYFDAIGMNNTSDYITQIEELQNQMQRVIAIPNEIETTKLHISTNSIITAIVLIGVIYFIINKVITKRKRNTTTPGGENGPNEGNGPPEPPQAAQNDLIYQI